jgi:regulator of nucleoside diphosphate kinase
MQNKTIRITRLDMQRLQSLLDNPDLMQQRPYLQKLESELRRAEVVEPHLIPPDIVTMNSTVRLLDQTSGETLVFTLVYPDQAAIRDWKISVLAPVGTAILGCRVGDTIDWDVPAGRQRVTIDSILYQTEAAGEYSL